MNLEELKSLCEFEGDNECYVLIAIARKKYNPEIKSEAAVFREVVKRPEDIERKYKKLRILVRNFEHSNIRPEDFNLYVTANPRCCAKAYKMLKQRFAQWDYEGLYPHIKKITGEWFSCLQTPECRARKRFFVLDIDTKDHDFLDKVAKALMDDGINIVDFLTIPTRSGIHMLVEPGALVNVRKLASENKELMEIKPDGLVFIERGGLGEIEGVGHEDGGIKNINFNL
jgi:hypothetical protein